MRPWEKPIWKPAKGKGAVLFFLVLIHLLAAAGLILYPQPGLPIFGIAVLFFAAGGLGTTVVYHRGLAHRTLKLNPILEHLLIFCAMFGAAGSPGSWVAYHRHHHSNTDTPDDISSPKHAGFWWAHLRWLYQCERADKLKWCPELTRGPYKFWTYAQPAVLLCAIFGGFFFGWRGFFWLGAIRLVYTLHVQCLVNSLTHLGEADQHDSSQNIWWLGPLQLGAWGENWHKNHHSHAGSARLGLHWWQPDVGWYFICLMEVAGLAYNVKRPRLS